LLKGLQLLVHNGECTRIGEPLGGFFISADKIEVFGPAEGEHTDVHVGDDNYLLVGAAVAEAVLSLGVFGDHCIDGGPGFGVISVITYDEGIRELGGDGGVEVGAKEALRGARHGSDGGDDGFVFGVGDHDAGCPLPGQVYGVALEVADYGGAVADGRGGTRYGTAAIFADVVAEKKVYAVFGAELLLVGVGEFVDVGAIEGSDAALW